jgi:hypothetical protein
MRGGASKKSNPSPGMLESSSLENSSLVDASIDWIRRIWRRLKVGVAGSSAGSLSIRRSGNG